MGAMLSGRRILITGGAGFIGSHLAERLIPGNHVVVLDNFRRDALSAAGLVDHPCITVIRGDVLDADVVRESIRDCEAVVHMASIAGVDTVMRNPVLTMHIALYGTMNVLDAAHKHGSIRRLVDFSTSEVFGRYAYQVTEFDATTLGAVGEARWTYAVAKLATEHLAMNYYKEYGLPTCSIRPFNIYGPRQVGEGAIHHFIRRALAGDPLVVHNDGAQIRAWCYIDDIVEAIVRALERPDAVGHAFNIGNPRSTATIYNLAREIVRLTESSSQIEFESWPYPDVEIRVPAVDKARDMLGFRAKVDLEEGLLRTIDWYRNHG
ncbi:MAG: NAD-dependent epimerase/dehydratase family protein [Proteobacteria bacterium]|nr:NAD-dependent epimerase/dehydratase family protein [Pseudomonadota bacterium]